jgi:hypothetical protein
MGGYVSTSVLRVVGIAMALMVGVGGAGRAGAQSAAAANRPVRAPDEKLIQGMCDATARIVAAQTALEASLARAASETNANAAAAKASPPRPQKPVRDASAEFKAMFAAMDGLDSVWAAMDKEAAAATRGV